MTSAPTRVLPSGGSAILEAWRQMHGPEALRRQAGPAGAWLGAPSGRLHTLTSGNAGRALRGYMAASNDRLVADLSSLMGEMSGNAEVRQSLRTMRRRSRQLANDNEFVKRFLQLIRNNVAGPRGFNLQSKIYKARKAAGVLELDTGANDTIEAAYAEFSKLGTFTACGQLSRGAFERAAITGVARDGEIIIETLYGRQFGRFGLAWRLIDPDLLDDQLNIAPGHAYPGFGKLDAGNDVRMGVERNPYGRPVAYWFFNVHPGDDGYAAVRHRRVPAERILHRFLAEEMRPDTARGVPWIYAAARRMGMLGGYEEAALVNARMGASKGGFFKQPAAEGGPVPKLAADGTPVADEEDAAGNLMTEAEPGVFGVLPPGWDFEAYDPAYPNDAMAGFVKGMLRAFSAGVGLTYNTIGQDLEGVSLSAMRHGANQDRDTYEAIQQWMRESVCEPMFSTWLGLGLSLGEVGRLPADGFDRFNKPAFIARTFRSPDPQKDVAAAAQKVALGITSRTRLCAEEGIEFEEVLDELAQEEAMAKAKGVTLNTQQATASKTPQADNVGQPVASGQADPEDGTDNPQDPEEMSNAAPAQ
jgi:lambda family phage portal protein